MTARLLKDPNTASCRIFVGHLQTDELTKMELEEHFAKYGSVIGVLMNRGFGFVQFENERSAQAAIQSEDGQMFKGRRIDVKPAKKDGGGGGGGGGGDKSKSGGVGSQFGGRNSQQRNSFGGGNQSFGGSQSQNFNSSNQSFINSQQNTSPNSSFDDKPKSADNSQSDEFNDDRRGQDHDDDQKFGGNTETNDSFNNNDDRDDSDSFNQTRNSNSQFCSSQGRSEETSGGNNSGNSNNSNSGSANNSQNRGGKNQNRNQAGNQNNQGNQQTRTRGSRGGKNRNKNRDNPGGNSFRDRSPLNRGNRGNDDKARPWEMDKMRSSTFGPRDSYNDLPGRFDDRFKDMMPAPNYRPMGPPDYPPVVEKNDCEIIVVHKSLTEYAEAIEARLKKMGLTVDLLFPNEDVPLSRVLGNIANRGCLYAVVVVPINQEHHSLTLNILHGLPQEHRNMPVEDALNLIGRDFSNYKSGSRGVPLNTPFTSDRHPDAIQVLLNMLADNHQLTVLQYDRVLKYLEIKREEQVQVELGDAKDLPASALSVNDPKQAELQSRILNILNSNKPNANAPAPSPVPAPAPVPPATWAAAATTTSTSSSAPAGVTPSPLLNDPTVQKALDSLLQGNLLKSIGDPQPPATSAQPLFAAFPNINRF